MHYKLINEMTDDELNDFFYFEEFSSRRSQEIENIVANDLERIERSKRKLNQIISKLRVNDSKNSSIPSI